MPSQIALGGAWSDDGTILFAPNPGALLRVPASGGAVAPATTLDATKKEIGHTFPWFLPDGRHFLFLATSLDGNFLNAGSLDESRSTRLGPADSKAFYANGYLLFVRQSALVAQPFDTDRLATTGDPKVVVQDVSFAIANGTGGFSVSVGGTLAYRTDSGASPTQLTIVDRNGREIQTVGEPDDQTAVALSPDGMRVAVSVFDVSRRTRDLWVHDLKRGVRTRLTFNPGEDLQPAWSPDASRLTFSAGRPSRLDIYRQPANGAGAEEKLFEGGGNAYPTSWSPDGRFLMYFTGFGGSQTGNDLAILPVAGDRKPLAFLQSSFNESNGVFSPDGRWVAYRSNESGRNEVWVVPFPGPGGKWQVSTAGGDFPRWRHDGKELFYLANTTVMSAAVSAAGGAFEVGAVRRLFDARLRTDSYLGFGTGYTYDVFPDGQRFVLDVTASSETTPSQLRVITNWTSTLRQGGPEGPPLRSETTF